MLKPHHRYVLGAATVGAPTDLHMPAVTDRPHTFVTLFSPPHPLACVFSSFVVVCVGASVLSVHVMH